MNPKEIYTQNLNRYTSLKNKLDSRSAMLSNIRLAVFASGVVLAVLAFIYADFATGFIVSGAGLAVFIFLIFRHDAVIRASKKYGNLIEINKMCLGRLDGSWVDFSADGGEFADKKHPYTSDLDIYGKSSLYQLINCSNTFHGQNYLRQLLENPDKDPARIAERQKAVADLASRLDFCQNLQSSGMDAPELHKEPVELLSYFEDKSKPLGAKWISYIFTILPMLTLLSIIICLIDRTVSVYIPISLLIVQAIINLLGYKAFLSVNSVYTYRRKIYSYEKLLGIIENVNFQDQYLNGIKESFMFKGKSAIKQIRTLENIVNAIEAAKNFPLNLILNILLFWNIHCVMALENWKEQSGGLIRGWLENIGKVEALASLAMLSHANPHWTYPGFDEGKTGIQAAELGHPLIPADKRVCNDFEMVDRICIITGSNMSGKSTLLRTVGINLVLAYAGAPVCAAKFRCSILDIFTSMRLGDDLSSGVSTFYAELLRIRTIIESSKSQKPMIFLIDEVFRGTNSRDRYTGAKNILLNINKKWIIGLISTHDFDLCELEKNDSGRIVNYHFTEKYRNNEIIFDYRLRPGRCSTTNAKYLMRMVGIELLEP